MAHAPRRSRPYRASALRLGVLAVLLVALGGCRGCVSPRPPVHLNPNMDYQPKYQAQEPSEFFADGAVMQAPPPGTVALEDPVEMDGFATGKVGGALVGSVPAAARDAFGGEDEMLERGAERYAIYCAVCHGESGDGRGPLYHRSAVESGDLRQARLRGVGDGHIFDVITHGLGLMSSYAAQIPVEDRWAIVAYVRQLQAEAPVTEGGEPQAAVGGGMDPSLAEEGGPLDPQENRQPPADGTGDAGETGEDATGDTTGDGAGQAGDPAAAEPATADPAAAETGDTAADDGEDR